MFLTGLIWERDLGGGGGEQKNIGVEGWGGYRIRWAGPDRGTVPIV